jgi:hypothetical protein
MKVIPKLKVMANFDIEYYRIFLYYNSGVLE